IFGIAGGALDEAMRNHGTAFKQRWSIVRDRTLAMKAIWRDEIVEYHGEYVDFDPMWSFPKPLQAGGPPIWIGSNSKWVPGRVADYADGWIVYNGRYQGDAVHDLRAACDKQGRSFGDVTLALMDAPWDAGEAAGFLEQGYSKLIFLVPPDSCNIEADLDRIGAVAARLRP
ncbi:MAG: LLM class flavin-dependent oxidoreductase, partial [Gammaproteobacteria bacterium]